MGWRTAWSRKIGWGAGWINEGVTCPIGPFQAPLSSLPSSSRPSRCASSPPSPWAAGRGTPGGRQARRAWGQQVTEANRQGGNGFIAIDAFKRGATDGHDLIQQDNVRLSACPHLFKKRPCAAARDFDVLLPLLKTNHFFSTSTHGGHRNVGDLIADTQVKDADFALFWDPGHAGHCDVQDAFAWIDQKPAGN